jgi:hypothetical protein
MVGLLALTLEELLCLFGILQEFGPDASITGDPCDQAFELQRETVTIRFVEVLDQLVEFPQGEILSENEILHILPGL